jgi:chaperonin cofactor prefoldin
MILKKELHDRIEELEKEITHLEDSRDALTKRIE